MGKFNALYKSSMAVILSLLVIAVYHTYSLTKEDGVEREHSISSDVGNLDATTASQTTASEKHTAYGDPKQFNQSIDPALHQSHQKIQRGSAWISNTQDFGTGGETRGFIGNSDPNTNDMLDGMTIEEIRDLHARQLKASRNYDPDEWVIEPTESEPGVTLAEAQALHQKQAVSALSEITADAQVPMPDTPEIQMTLSDIQALHEKQQLQAEENRRRDVLLSFPTAGKHIDILESELSRLHDKQHKAFTASITTDADQHFVTPVAEDGGPLLTIREVREMHEQQLDESW